MRNKNSDKEVRVFYWMFLVEKRAITWNENDKSYSMIHFVKWLYPIVNFQAR